MERAVNCKLPSGLTVLQHKGKGKGKGKGKVHPITGHEGPEGEKACSSTLSLTSALDGVGGQRHAPAALPRVKTPGTHCTGGWVRPRAGLDRCGKSSPHRNSIPGLSIS